MQAAFISYAVFLALFFFAVVVLVIIVAVRTMLAHMRGPQGESRAASGDERPRT